jgi:hypothetical protein
MILRVVELSQDWARPCCVRLALLHETAKQSTDPVQVIDLWLLTANLPLFAAMLGLASLTPLGSRQRSIATANHRTALAW